MNRIAEEDENKRPREVDEELNSGFASYLRSSEGTNTISIGWHPIEAINQSYLNIFRLSVVALSGLEMMKMFVIANTMLVFFTVAWPSIKESLFIIRDYFMDEF